MSIASSSNESVRSVVTDFNANKAGAVQEAIGFVQDKISPVWPLRDYVAVNPYAGMSNRKFLDARQQLQAVSDCETLMPLSYYQDQFQKGKFGVSELELAIDEMVVDQIEGAESLNANAICKILGSATAASMEGVSMPSRARTRAVSQRYDRSQGTAWTETITEEISKHCSSHYDEGQARWSNPWQGLPLYQAWRSAAQLDRRIEFQGLSGFRRFVQQLPSTPEAAIVLLLAELDVPQARWADFLFCLAMTCPGWSAWTKYKTIESRKKGFESPDFTGLIAIRLAYDVALSRRFAFEVDFESVEETDAASSNTYGQEKGDESLLGMTLLRANEIGLRKRVLNGIKNSKASVRSTGSALPETATQRKLAQMVFCIDVRSERMRRQLESTSSEIETYGFAGFFGMPFEYVRIGSETGTNQLPVLLDPQFRVFEEVRPEPQREMMDVTASRNRIRGFRYQWKSFQSSAASCFAFVESTGLFYGYKLASRLFGRPAKDTTFDGVAASDHDRLGPGFRDLHRQGVLTTDQVDMAESMLRGIGLTKDFARLVVLCGHAASTENNPLQAGLDCGACAGHSGEVNARFGAMLLNKPFIRSGLAERGIEISNEVHFLAGLHNTTTDDIRFFDLDLVPGTHAAYVTELSQSVSIAGRLTREERLASLPGANPDSLLRRSVDWSEVRPEWGLTGNAAFIVGPRSLTSAVDLRGEAFLHSYDFRTDPGSKVLEQIMTAPLVVANMINMQYYASTVDQKHFGSGNKTVHNVVGKFGVLSGNGGDLTTGLPWESIHNGKSYQHDPMRLLAVIEAPRTSIERILEQQQNVRELIANGWVNLVAIDGDAFYRHTENGGWQQLDVGWQVNDQDPNQLSTH